MSAKNAETLEQTILVTNAAIAELNCLVRVLTQTLETERMRKLKESGATKTQKTLMIINK